MGLQEVKTADELIQILNDNESVLIKFTASWCRPCHSIAPYLQQKQAEYKNIKFIEVDTDKSPDVSARYNITAMPTMVFIHSKKETRRVRGADPRAITAALNALSDLTTEETAAGSSASAPVVPEEIEKFIPKGFEPLNDIIHFGEAEGLNISNASSDLLRQLFALKEQGNGVTSEADSQLMFYLPLNNKVKVHSIIVKTKVHSSEDDVQPASKIKVWANTTGTLSFEDAASGIKALHSGVIDTDDKGYGEIKLRFVHFQNVSSLLLLIDGEDEDASTTVQQIILVGSKGEKREQRKLEKVEEA